MTRESLALKKKRVALIIDALNRTYPEAACTLDHRSPFELLAATILAAQCTDAKVNTVTPELFRRWPDAFAMASADSREVEDIVHPLGFFRQKSKSLIEMSREIVLNHNGEVPSTLTELTKLRGVGRKTANVVLDACFGGAGGAGIVVDTHCKRISRRLGLIGRETDPTRIEFALMNIIQSSDWPVYGHLMVWHGRAICLARRPLCEVCPVLQWCPEGKIRTGGMKL